MKNTINQKKARIEIRIQENSQPQQSQNLRQKVLDTAFHNDKVRFHRKTIQNVST